MDQNRVEEAETHIPWSVQVEGVSNSLTLHDILTILEPTTQSIIAIFRKFDFHAKQAKSTVFIQLLNYREMIALTQNNILQNNYPLWTFSSQSLVSERVDHHEAILFASNNEQWEAPISLCLSGIDTNIPMNEITPYLTSLSRFFCENFQVTSFRLIVDLRRKKLRSFAFVDFSTIAECLEFHNKTLEVGNLRLKCEVSRSFPILLHQNDLAVLEACEYRWCARIRDVNLLIACEIPPNPVREVVAVDGGRNLVIRLRFDLAEPEEADPNVIDLHEEVDLDM